jgi:hypothetical protein
MLAGQIVVRAVQYSSDPCRWVAIAREQSLAHGKSPHLYRAPVPPRAVLASFSRRDEDEVVVDPGGLTILALGDVPIPPNEAACAKS